MWRLSDYDETGICSYDGFLNELFLIIYAALKSIFSTLSRLTDCLAHHKS